MVQEVLAYWIVDLVLPWSITLVDGKKLNRLKHLKVLCSDLSHKFKSLIVCMNLGEGGWVGVEGETVREYSKEEGGWVGVSGGGDSVHVQ